MKKSRLTCLLTVSAAIACGTSANAQDAAAPAKIDFEKQIVPILEGACVHCHGTEKQEGEFRIDLKEDAFRGGESYDPGIDPGKPDDSAIFWMTELDHDDELIMPPKKLLPKWQQDLLKQWITEGAEWSEGLVLNEEPRMDFKNNILPILQKGGPFSEQQRKMLKLWTDQGAEWPEGFTLAGAGEDEGGPKDDIELIKIVREEIIAGTPEKAEADMKAYKNKIPKTGVEYEMVPIPGGEFTMGSPDSEAKRRDDEGPQHKVKIEPFWMGKYEVAWAMYEPFMITDVSRKKDGSPEKIAADALPVDITSSPTTPYTEMSFGMGTDGFPAISMTQHAGNKFCQWLSAQTGHFYRLPTEAEWEYACRAGTTTAYHFGDDPAQLGDYAWFYDNADNRYQKLGQKKPNPWGLYDMHGNVMEWCLDQYVEKTYGDRQQDKTNITPFNKPTTLYPRVARGGSWYDYPEDVRASARFGSEEGWKVQDPQLPKSIWYHTDAPWLGMRLVRPLKTPAAQQMEEYWSGGIPPED